LLFLDLPHFHRPFLFPYTTLFRSRSNLAFSTFKIFPRNGRIACVILSLPSTALPPAESPSTKKISHSLASLLLQSDNLPHVLVIDRKSTRLNSIHVSISYAVFCLK